MRPKAVALAAFTAILLITCALSAYFIYRILTYEPEEHGPLGFTKGTAMRPVQASDRAQRAFDPRPPVTTTQIPSYSLAMQWTFQNDSIYENAGSAVAISLQNTGSGPVYAYGIGIIWDRHGRSLTYEEGSGFLVNSEETQPLGMVSFSGPTSTGNPVLGNSSYMISVRLLAQDSGGDWADLGEIKNNRRHLEVLPLENRTPHENITNPDGYYQLVNGLFKDKDWVRQKAMDVAGNSTTSPDAYQICRLFDFIKSNMTYICDPDQSGNEWITPKETILRGGGDCEDQAMTMAAFAMSLGATTRCHFTSTHAFASIFCGDISDLHNVTASISIYYGLTSHPPEIVSYQDTFGYWIMMDPIAGFYPGAPPLGCSPVKAGNDGYGWDFIRTEHVISIDIIA